jgi:hypothetical protein
MRPFAFDSLRIYVNQSRAGHWIATVRNVGSPLNPPVFKSDKRSTREAARAEAEAFITANARARQPQA